MQNQELLQQMVAHYKHTPSIKLGQEVITPAEGVGIVVGVEIPYCKFKKLLPPKVAVWCGKMVCDRQVIYTYSPEELKVKI